MALPVLFTSFPAPSTVWQADNAGATNAAIAARAINRFRLRIFKAPWNAAHPHPGAAAIPNVGLPDYVQRMNMGLVLSDRRSFVLRAVADFGRHSANHIRHALAVQRVRIAHHAALVHGFG